MKKPFEIVMGDLKDRTEGFDDSYYPCMKEECELEHIYKWTGLFVFMYNSVRADIKFRLLTHLIGVDIRQVNTSVYAVKKDISKTLKSMLWQRKKKQQKAAKRELRAKNKGLGVKAIAA